LRKIINLDLFLIEIISILLSFSFSKDFLHQEPTFCRSFTSDDSLSSNERFSLEEAPNKNENDKLVNAFLFQQRFHLTVEYKFPQNITLIN